ncbi:MAG TPA: hypothetical protein VFM45_12750, partial [Anaeromyxobacteraceae bacterium]|nr:hypothetical protein [Anaeromyxobacteraceae bacterium]
MRTRSSPVQAATAAALAALVAGLTLAALLLPRPDACRPPPALAGPPGLLRPAPLVSLGCPVAASAPGARVLVDGRYRADAWGGGRPTP